jgi:hypothetical protein
LSDAKITAQRLDNLAKLQQMKLNTRLAALEAATKIVSSPGFTDRTIPEHAANSVTVHTTIAIAQELEGYILGGIEAETEEALKAAQDRLRGPQIVRP